MGSEVEPKIKVDESGVFMVRWLFLMVISIPVFIFLDELFLSGFESAIWWLIFMIFGTPILFYRKETYRGLLYWYLMIRGRPPGDFWNFVEEVERE